MHPFSPVIRAIVELAFVVITDCGLYTTRKKVEEFRGAVILVEGVSDLIIELTLAPLLFCPEISISCC